MINKRNYCNHAMVNVAMLGMLQQNGFELMQKVTVKSQPFLYILFRRDTNQVIGLFYPVDDEDNSLVTGKRWSLRFALSYYQQILLGKESVDANLVRQLERIPYIIPLHQIKPSGLLGRRRIHWTLVYSDGVSDSPLHFIDSKCYLGYDLAYVQRAVKEFVGNNKVQASYLGNQPIANRNDGGRFIVCILERILAGENLAAPVAIESYVQTFNEYLKHGKKIAEFLPASNCSSLKTPAPETFWIRHKFAIKVLIAVAIAIAFLFVSQRLLAPLVLLLFIKLGWGGILVGHSLLHAMLGIGVGAGKSSALAAIVVPVVGGILFGIGRMVVMKSIAVSKLAGGNLTISEFALRVPSRSVIGEGTVRSGGLGMKKMVKGPKLALAGLFAQTKSVSTAQSLPGQSSTNSVRRSRSM